MQRQMMTPINQRLSFVKSVIERGEVAAFAQVGDPPSGLGISQLGKGLRLLLFRHAKL
jgi:hypothetical protein